MISVLWNIVIIFFSHEANSIEMLIPKKEKLDAYDLRDNDDTGYNMQILYQHRANLILIYSHPNYDDIESKIRKFPILV